MFTCQCTSGYTGDKCETSNHYIFPNQFFSVARLCFCVQISTNVRLCLARTKERASMELTNSRVSAWKAIQETNARQVIVAFVSKCPFCRNFI